MKIQKAYKTELRPNNYQKTLLLKSCGATRFVWNWGLSRVKEGISKPNAMQLHKELNSRKSEDFPWIYEVSKCCGQEALRDIQKAFNNFFTAKKNGRVVGYPKFKSKKNAKHSFRLTGSIHIKEDRIQLPRLGWLRLKEKNYLPTQTHILSATVSKEGERWFVSLAVEEEMIERPNDSEQILGIDLGVKTLATCSDGTQYANVRALRQKATKLKRLQKKLSRQKKGSNRREVTRKQINRTHYRISCIRKDVCHKITSEIVKTKRPLYVVMEDLNVAGMVKNRKLAKSVSDAAMSEFRRQMEYKGQWYGVGRLYVETFYPSSKLCSGCSAKNDLLTLSDRIYKCLICGISLDRDLNASIVLEKAGSSFVSAYGGSKAHSDSNVIRWEPLKCEQNRSLV